MRKKKKKMQVQVVPKKKKRDKAKEKHEKRVIDACHRILAMLNKGDLTQRQSSINCQLGYVNINKKARKKAWKFLDDVNEAILMYDGRCVAVGRVAKLPIETRQTELPKDVYARYKAKVRDNMTL